jgi:RNA polymerase sigma-70 factor, ECF subfamily
MLVRNGPKAALIDQMLMLPDLEIDDQTLVRRFQAGETQVFDQIVERHFEPIGRLVARLLAWRGEVQDVVQETFIVAFEKLSQFEGRSQLRTWLSTIALRTARRSLRMRRFQFWKSDAEISFEPECEIESRERAEKVRAAVRALSDSLREVVVLHYLEGESIQSTAEILGLRVNTVEVRLHRARKLLGESLEGQI